MANLSHLLAEFTRLHTATSHQSNQEAVSNMDLLDATTSPVDIITSAWVKKERLQPSVTAPVAVGKSSITSKLSFMNL